MPGPRPALIGLVAMGLVALGAATTSPASAQGLNTARFNPTMAIQTWPVPTGVRSVGIALTGGAGGKGANGAFTFASTTTATLTIPPGVSALDVAVGDRGEDGTNAVGRSVSRGGWPNGGSSSTNGYWTGGGGGGSTDIRPSGAPFTSALIVTGGAGGSGGYGETAWGGVGGFGAAGAAGFGQVGQGSDGGAGGAPGAMPTGSTGQGGDGQGPGGDNVNSGSGGGGGGGWRGGAAGSPGTAWVASFRSGGGGGGGGGMGSAVPQYVAGVSSYAGNTSSSAQIQYLSVKPPSIPTMAVGTFATWTYIAGQGATYAVTSGALPPGLTLDGSTGQVQGVPTQAGTFAFTVTASVYPGGTYAVSTAVAGTATVDTGGPASIVATSATNIGPTSATMNGAVVAGGSQVSGLTCAYTTRNPGGGTIDGPVVPASPSSVAPTSTGAATAVSCPVAGLVGNRTYYYQVQGVQSGSLVRSGAASFRTNSTAARPMVMPPSAVTQASATANGVVSAAQNVNALFCRRATSITRVSTGTRTVASPASTKGVVLNTPLSCALTGLRPNTVYHYAVFATDAFATTMSPMLQSFTTRVSPPRVGTISARAVTSTTAVINGSVIPTNEAVTGITCRVVVSPGNPAQGTPVAATPAELPATPRKQSATCNLSGLAPSTTYLVRMEATDVTGTGASGNTVRLTTSASGAAPTPPGPALAPTVDIVSATPRTGSRIEVGVRVNRAGTIRVTGTLAQGTQASAGRAIAAARATAPACSAARAVKGAGTFTVSCPLQARTRDLLRSGPVAIALRATLTTSTAKATTATRTVRVPRFPPRVLPVTG
jgi:hypothetical protein